MSESPPVATRTPHTIRSVSDQISSIVLTRRTPPGWYFGLGLSGVMESVSTSLLESGLETIFQKLARRASEGIVNGALILRLAEAVKQQCRPVPPKPAGASELLSVVRDLFLRRPESAVVPN